MKSGMDLLKSDHKKAILNSMYIFTYIGIASFVAYMITSLIRYNWYDIDPLNCHNWEFLIQSSGLLIICIFFLYFAIWITKDINEEIKLSGLDKEY